jgi:hypothetical protein
MHLRIHPAPPLNACTKDAFRTMGQVTVHVRYLNSEHRLPLVIAKGQFPKLMGLDWTDNMQDIDWNIIMKPNPVCLFQYSMNLRYGDKYPNVFIPNTNPIREFRVSLQLKNDATPVFCPARDPPIPLRKAIEEELHNLQTQGLIRKIFNQHDYRSYYYKREINDATIADSNNKLSYESWEAVFAEKDINTAFNIFLNIYLTILHSSFPVKKTPP